jgi:NMD protein affecting ribosome stability and mRNA decay
MAAALESKELLGLCLKRIRGLNKVRLVDARWIWTEPHSNRLKIELTIQKVLSRASFADIRLTRVLGNVPERHSSKEFCG